jgi:hypothetical protein
MIYYECYHISKSYNFNMKLNYIFNNMEHQALVTFTGICVIVITPKTKVSLSQYNLPNSFLHWFQNLDYKVTKGVFLNKFWIGWLKSSQNW